MADYRKMPLGPLANVLPNRIGEIVECPYCPEHALKVPDYKDSLSGSKEKEDIYIHFEDSVIIRTEKNGRIVEEVQTIVNSCNAKTKPNSPQTPSPEENPRE